MTTPTNPAADTLSTIAPLLLLIWLAALAALTIWQRRIRNTPVAGHADIIAKATRGRQHARARIGWHALGALTITTAFGLLSWPTALAAVPLLIIPALGIRKWARTARTYTHMLNAPRDTRRAQLRR